MIAPTKADQNPAMEMPAPNRLTDSQLASSSMRPFTTSWKMPSEMMVTGSEMTVTSGFTSELTTERASPTSRKQTQGSAPPKGAMPGTMAAETATATEVSSQLRIKRMEALLSVVC